jgi:hypothetical protein
MSRAMNNVYTHLSAGAISPPLYLPGAIDSSDFRLSQPSISAMMVESLDALEEAHHGIYLGFSKLRKLSGHVLAEFEAPIIPVQVWNDTSPTKKSTVNMTLWELGNRYIMSGREVATNHWLMSNNGTTDLTTNQFWNFVIDNGPRSLCIAFDEMLDALVTRSSNDVATVKATLLVLLVVEAIILVLSALAYIIFLVRLVGNYRFHIFAIFLLVPSGELDCQP